MYLVEKRTSYRKLVRRVHIFNSSGEFCRKIVKALERGKRVITTYGTPAWSPSASATEDKSDGNGYGGRLIYLKGYRDGSGETRVELLKNAIERICG